MKRIALEYHPKSGNFDALAQYLEKVGFKISFWKERRLLYGLREQKVGLSASIFKAS